MSEFDHDYYFLDEKMKETVLCMKCSQAVKKPGYTKEQIRDLYTEVKVKWQYGNGITADGVVITCPSCKDFEFSDSVSQKIQKQVIKALELQMTRANKNQDEINHLTNLFSHLKLVGRV